MLRFFSNKTALLLAILLLFSLSYQDAGALTTKTKTPIQKPITILLVPGHEPNDGGATYKNILERDMTVRLAKYISDNLATDKKYKVIVARDWSTWNTTFAEYFVKEKINIQNFIKTHSAITKVLLNSGVQTNQTTNYHNNASDETVLHLYGINRWANDNNVDAIIHIHFNDPGGRSINKAGEYEGLSIYVPEKQFINAGSSLKLAQNIYPQLNKYLATSTLKQELSGIVEDQDLIAIGSQNTLTVPAILIEYGYIYEKPYRLLSTRLPFYQKLAKATVIGIKNNFEAKK